VSRRRLDKQTTADPAPEVSPRTSPGAGKGNAAAARYCGVSAPIQRKPAGATRSAGAQRDGTMPKPVQSKMEHAFGGADFSAVRIHQGPQAAAVGALAYTQGSDIHFQPGAYEPETQSGQEVLGHELTHVVQQSQGRVSAPTQAKGAPINADGNLEREADRKGAAAARGQRVGGDTAGSARSSSAAPIQRLKDDSIINLDDTDLAEAVIQICGKDSPDSSAWDEIRKQARAILQGQDTDERSRRLAGAIGQISFKKLGGHKERLIGLATAVREGRFRHQAQSLETRDHGHSLDRHGPEVTDDKLVTRLETGIAPDGVKSPAPGLSTKFVSYELWLETRAKALITLQGAIDSTIDYLDDDIEDYREKKRAWQTSTPGAHKAPGQPLHKAMTDAKAVVGIMVDNINSQVPNPKKAPARFHANKSEPEELVTLSNSYTVLLDHGKTVGEGHRGTTQDSTDPQLYTDTTPVTSLTQSRTGIEPTDRLSLFDDAVDITVDAWQVFQHFPAEEPTMGIR